MPEVTSNQATNDEQKDPLFFNVPPKLKGKGSLVSFLHPGAAQKKTPLIPSAGIAKPGISQTHSNKILWIAIAVIICAAGGYVGYTFWHQKSNAPETQAPPPATQEAPPEPAPSPTESAPPPAAPITVTTPEEWRIKFFNGAECTQELVCADTADPDRDGLANLEEQKLGTDPNNPDSDGDGLSDGDEVHIFGGNPLNIRTAENKDYTDADDARGGFDSTNKGEPMKPDRIGAIAKAIKEFGLHQPTVGTLVDHLSQYGADVTGNPVEPSTGAQSGNEQNPSVPPPPGVNPSVDQSAEAMLTRDTQRSATIQKFGVALVKYQHDSGNYPITDSFPEMLNKIKPYNPIATNPVDPLGIAPYVYTYNSTDGKSFTLTYFSETQNQTIKYTENSAIRDASAEIATRNDEQRAHSLESIRSALLIYSAANASGGQLFVFPPKNSYEAALVPKYLQSMPKDPTTQGDYSYEVSKKFDSFTLKAIFENPPVGNTGYLCNQEECQNY